MILEQSLGGGVSSIICQSQSCHAQNNESDFNLLDLLSVSVACDVARSCLALAPSSLLCVDYRTMPYLHYILTKK